MLYNAQEAIFECLKSQYRQYVSLSFISVKSKGVKNDKITDNTAIIQLALNSAITDQIIYFNHGAYIVLSTVKVSKNIKINNKI